MRTSVGNKGFSLLELLVVLGLTMVVALIAAPATSELRNHYRLRATADQITGEISKARMHAVGQGVFTRVRFTDGGYVVESSEDGSTYTTTAPPFALPAGMSIEASNPTFGRTGLASSPVHIFLEQNNSRTTLFVNVLGRVTES